MKKIPYFKISISKNDISKVNQTLKNNWLTMGKITEKFEKMFSNYLDVNINSCIATSSCTASLHLIMLALKLKKGDEVIMPSLTFAADANTVFHSGAKPVFADSNSLEDLTINIKDIKKKITSKTKVVIIMHYGGYPSDIKEILKLKKKYNFFLIEDACHSLFSNFSKNKKLGTFGDASTFSFYSNKNMTTGEGGMIYIKNKDLSKKIKFLRNHGIDRSMLDRKDKFYVYNIKYPGLNYRIDDLRSTLGLSQLKSLNKNNLMRRKIALNYVNLIKKNKLNLTIPFEKYIGGKYSYHLFVIILPPEKNNRSIIPKLLKKGVQTSFHYPPIHMFNFYKRKKVRLPVVEEATKRLISLPMYPTLTLKEQYIIVDTIKKLLIN